MDLIGQNQYSRDLHGLPIGSDPQPNAGTETIVDGAALLGGSVGVAGSDGVIGAGFDNGIRGITVRGNANVAAEILVNQFPADGGGMSVEIRDCILENGRRSIQFVQTAAGTTSTAIIEGNILRHNRSAFGFGIQLYQATSSAGIRAEIRRNLVYDNDTGLFIPMVGASDSETTVRSEGNVYTANRIGINVVGGRDFGLPVGQPLPPGVELPASSGNRMTLDSDGDVVANNVGTLAKGGGVGIFAKGGLRDCPPLGLGTTCALGGFGTGPNGGDVSDNKVWLTFKGTIFVRGSGAQNGTPGSTNPSLPFRSDLRIIGAGSATTSLPGTGNVVTVVVREGTSDNAPGAFAIADSTLPDPGGTNRVIATVVNSNNVSDPTPFPAIKESNENGEATY